MKVRMPRVLSQPQVIPSKFHLGQIVFSARVNALVAENQEFEDLVIGSLMRHARCDWGDMCAEDKRENEFSMDNHLRLFSAYNHKALPKIWIITEANCLATTVLFPDEY